MTVTVKDLKKALEVINDDTEVWVSTDKVNAVELGRVLLGADLKKDVDKIILIG